MYTDTTARIKEAGVETSHKYSLVCSVCVCLYVFECTVVGVVECYVTEVA